MNIENIKDKVSKSATAALAFILWMITIITAVSNVIIYAIIYAIIFIVTNTLDTNKTAHFLSDISVVYKILIAASIIATLVYVIEVGVKKLCNIIKRTVYNQD